MNTFTAGSCIKFGWETFKKRPWFFVWLSIVYIVMGWIFGFVSGFVGGFSGAIAGQTVGNLSSFIVSFFLSVGLALGFIALMLKAHDNTAAVKIGDLWHPHPFWKYAGASLLVGIITVVGLILLVVPGIFAAVIFMFSGYVIIDRNLGPIESIKASVHLTKGHRWQLLALCLLVALINIAGLICFVVGILITIPLTSLAVVHAYRTLSQHPGETVSSV